MSLFYSTARRASLALVLSMVAAAAHGAPIPAPSQAVSGAADILPVRNVLRGIIDFLGDGDDYVHDDHYDWQRYRDTTSRKERVRDYYQMQQGMQMDFARQQLLMQKQMIKKQRGW